MGLGSSVAAVWPLCGPRVAAVRPWYGGQHSPATNTAERGGNE